jgi:NTP pyrophosphatase (non-canonical NTP hydrolase)
MIIKHSDLVSTLVKPGKDIVSTITPEDAHLLHLLKMVLGISGVAGEILDAVRKAVIYIKPIDRQNVIEELGDLEFYMEGLRQGLGITREETIVHNTNKLSKLYKSGNYSNEQAIARADKIESNDK